MGYPNGQCRIQICVFSAIFGQGASVGLVNNIKMRFLVMNSCSNALLSGIFTGKRKPFVGIGVII
jgi:hypothetical protein